MLYIAICDDEISSTKRINELAKTFFEQNKIAASIETFTSGEALLQSDIEKYNIIFLDVAMGQIDGIETAHMVRKKNTAAVLVYISALVEYAPHGYEVKAFRYLLKSTLEQTFQPCMEAVLEHMNLQEEMFEIRTGTEAERIPLKNIVYMDSDKRVVTIHTVNCERSTYQFYETLTVLEERLSGKGFLRIQKSFLVNMNYISSIKHYVVMLENGLDLKASEQNYHNVLQTYTLWKGRM